MALSLLISSWRAETEDLLLPDRLRMLSSSPRMTEFITWFSSETERA